MRNLSTSRSLVLLAGLICASSACAQLSPADHWKRGTGLSDRYADFNTHLMQVQTVKSIPFFNKTPTQRMSAIRGYYSSVRTGNVGGAASSLKGDFTSGALLKDVAIASMTQVLTQVSQGKSMDQAVSSTARYLMTPEYLIGNLMGGIGGAALGALIPVPFVGGFLGQVIAQVPTMTGAMLGSNMGAKIVHGIRNGNLDMGEVLRSIDWLSLGFQSVGATAGMLLGSTLPVPFLGQLVGGVIGGGAGSAAAKWLKGKFGLKQPDQDYIDLPQYDPITTPVTWLPATIPGTAANFAPAAPTTDPASLQAKLDEAHRQYARLEQSGDRAGAAKQYQAIVGLQAQLRSLR
jgi:hypothetical protein